MGFTTSLHMTCWKTTNIFMNMSYTENRGETKIKGERTRKQSII